MRGPMRPRLALLALSSTLLVVGGCDVVDGIFGGSQKGDRRDTHVLQAIRVETDHPIDVAVPGGAAVATDGELVRFSAIGDFINIDENDEPLSRPVTASVVWESSAPQMALPGADGYVTVLGSGLVTIIARTPAAGEVPAFESDPIALTILTAGSGG